MKKVHRWWKPKPKRDLEDNKGFYTSYAWRQIRKAVMSREHLCRVCWMHNDHLPREADMVDHFRPRRLWPNMEMSPHNLVPMCNKCHAKKSGRERVVHTQSEWTEKVLPRYKDLEDYEDISDTTY